MFIILRKLFFAPIFLFLAASMGALADGHAAEGERLFRSLRCAGCHEVGPEGRNKVGPHLNEIIGRAAGAVEGFRYSRAMVGSAEDGLVWDEDMLRAFLTAPADFLPRTRMAYRGVRNEEDIDHLLEFLRTLTPETNLGTAHLEPSDPEVAPEILRLRAMWNTANTFLQPASPAIRPVVIAAAFHQLSIGPPTHL